MLVSGTELPQGVGGVSLIEYTFSVSTVGLRFLITVCPYRYHIRITYLSLSSIVTL